MAFDYKKEYKEFYLPKAAPSLVTVPPMNYIAVRGRGDPNEKGGEYKASIGLLYAVAFTIKMSKLGDHRIEGYFDYVVPPLEGLWRQDGAETLDLTRKEDLRWISMIRLPDFVSPEDLSWAAGEAERKKKQDFSKVEFLTLKEDLCVQILHTGPYDEERRSISLMDEFVLENGLSYDPNHICAHHEIYLSDVRRVKPEKLRTVIRRKVVRQG